MDNTSELCETQSKIILNRINQAEKNFKTFAIAISDLTRKENRARDKMDELAKFFKTFENENSPSVAVAYEKLSQDFTNLSDIRTIQNSRYEQNMIQELKQYEFICSNAREEVKSLIAVRDREITKRQHKHQISENEKMISNMHTSKIFKELLEVSKTFEEQKLMDVKELLLNFILIQLKCMTTSITILNSAYLTASNIDTKSDLEEFVTDLKKVNRIFKKQLEHESRSNAKFKFMRIFSQSTSNLDRIGKKKKENLRSQSSISLNSIGSSSETIEVRKESCPIELSMDSKASDSNISDTDDDQSDITTEDIPERNHNKSHGTK